MLKVLCDRGSNCMRVQPCHYASCFQGLALALGYHPRRGKCREQIKIPHPKFFFSTCCQLISFWFVLVQVVAVLLASSVSSAFAIASVGKKGNTHAGWLPICGQVPKFCNHVTAALVAGFIAAILYFLLVIYTLYTVLNPLFVVKPWITRLHNLVCTMWQIAIRLLCWWPCLLIRRPIYIYFIIYTNLVEKEGKLFCLWTVNWTAHSFKTRGKILQRINIHWRISVSSKNIY